MKVVWLPGETGKFFNEEETVIAKVMFALGLTAGLFVALAALLLQAWLLGAI